MNILFIHEVDWLKKVALDFHNLAESLSLFNHLVYTIDYEDTWKRKRAFDLGSLRTKEYDGIEINPYQWEARYQYMWYYGWDVAVDTNGNIYITGYFDNTLNFAADWVEATPRPRQEWMPLSPGLMLMGPMAGPGGSGEDGAHGKKLEPLVPSETDGDPPSNHTCDQGQCQYEIGTGGNDAFLG
jgi:hypothetical protein